MTTSTYTFPPDDPAHRLAEVRRILATEGQKFPSVDHNGKPVPPDSDASVIDLGGDAA